MFSVNQKHPRLNVVSDAITKWIKSLLLGLKTLSKVR